MTTLSDFKETVRQQADIVRVIGDYIQLKKAGAQNFVGLCPFHGEKTPSFSVHATRQFFHCFGCGKSGDVFAFVQEREQISFPEAVRLIAEKVGVPLPKMQYSSESEAEDAGKRGKLIEMHERACKFFEDQLRRPEGAQAREYLAGRGLKEETIRTFRIGFAPDSGFTLKDRLKADFSEEMMRASGLFSWKEGSDSANTPERAKPARSGDPGSGGSATAAMYSKFRNRIMFPIANENGKIIAFTGRTLAKDEKSGPKYLNSPETPIYSKSRVLYNLDRAKEAIRKLGYVIIVEGQMDCIAVYSAGFHNVAASSGTAFTETQAGLISKLTKKIVVNFDRDKAGSNATDKSIKLLVEEEFEIKVVCLDPGFDPDLLIKTKGREAYQRELRDSQDYFVYLLTEARRRFRIDTPNGKVDALRFMLPSINSLPNQIARDEIVRDVAQKLGIDFPVLQRELKNAVQRRSSDLNFSFETTITHAEKVLVLCLCSESRESTFNARDYLLGLQNFDDLVAGLSTQSLLMELRTIAQQGGDILPASVSDPYQSTVAKLLSGEGVLVDEAVVRATILNLEHSQILRRRDIEVRTEIVEAERKNDVAALLRLKQEKLELDRKLASGG
jgi:DNA primase